MFRFFCVLLSLFPIFLKANPENFYILTGGPGAGKSTLIEELKRRGFFCIDEVARQVIQEESNLQRRIEKMVMRSLETYQEAVVKGAEVTIFDRGVLDYISYANRTNTPISQDFSALKYNKKVFMAPPWEEIYCNDAERTQSFEEALQVYEALVEIYLEHGYEIIELPKTDVHSRADFIINTISFEKEF